MNKRRPKSLTQAQITRLADAAKWVEYQPRYVPIPPRRPVEFPGGIMLIVSEAIGPMIGMEPGRGAGRILSFDGTIYADNSTIAFPILNDTDLTIALDAKVFCLPGYGFFHVVATGCGNVS